MPIFATLVAGAFNALFTFFGWFMAFDQAITWARRTFIVLLMVSFFAAVTACVTAVIGSIGTLPIPHFFLMGIGMFIPSNAGMLIGCLAGVWIACVVYRLKMDGLRF